VVRKGAVHFASTDELPAAATKDSIFAGRDTRGRTGKPTGGCTLHDFGKSSWSSLNDRLGAGYGISARDRGQVAVHNVNKAKVEQALRHFPSHRLDCLLMAAHHSSATEPARIRRGSQFPGAAVCRRDAPSLRRHHTHPSPPLTCVGLRKSSNRGDQPSRRNLAHRKTKIGRAREDHRFGFRGGGGGGGVL